VEFVVEAFGELPGEGRVHIIADGSGEESLVTLTADPQDQEKYLGQLARAIESFSFRVELGDAHSPIRSVRVMPLPKVDIELEITTPEYAMGWLREPGSQGRQHSALAGSRVVPVVTADKPLRSAAIEVSGKSFDMQPRGTAFVLETTDPLFARVSQSLRYQIQVIDEDGLKLERPAGGVLRVIPDRPPMVTCSTVSSQILPDASPTVYVAASDDFGIQRLVLHGSVIRLGDEPQAEEESVQVLRELVGVGPAVDRAMRINLAELGLSVGDRLTCTAEVIDDRGEFPGESVSSSSLIFEIVDRETVLANLRDFGERMDGKLDDIIKTQADVGER